MAVAKVLTNLDVMGEAIGHLQGIADALGETAYLEHLIIEAHENASEAFDNTVASVATVGYLAHMFEYGTAGVTRGPIKFPSPTIDQSHLWEHTLRGSPTSKTASFMFRPAKIRNPRLTTEATGVPSKYIRKMSRRKYIFWNRAFVMETGMSVSVKSDRGALGLLFIPTPVDNAPK